MQDKIIGFTTGVSDMFHSGHHSGDYYVDSDYRQWWDEIEVCSTERLKNEAHEETIIISTIFRYNEIKEKLEKYRYQESVHFFDGKCLLRENKICVYACEQDMPWDV